MKPSFEILLKVILAILFFICLADMPYGYFQIVRFAALVGFAILAYNANQQGQKREVIIYVCLAILFQPLIKIALGRAIWNVIDVVVGVYLIISLFIRIKNPSKVINIISDDKSMESKEPRSGRKSIHLD